MPVRLVVAAAVLVSAYVHLYEWLNGGVRGYRHVHVIGNLFIVNVVAGVVIAVLLVAWRHWLAPFLALGFGASTLGGFAISVQWGLFGDHEKWQGPYIWTAAVAEAVAILGGLYALVAELRTAPVPDRSAVGSH
ncbi:MAG: hypothetical protein WB797_17530 [Nocardioides sp.]